MLDDNKDDNDNDARKPICSESMIMMQYIALLYLSLFRYDAETTQRAKNRYKDHLEGQLPNYDVVLAIMVCLIRHHYHHEV